MKTTFKKSVLPPFRLFLEQSRSYCQQVGIPFIEPTLSQFLAANASTRDRLTAEREGKVAAD